MELVLGKERLPNYARKKYFGNEFQLKNDLNLGIKEKRFEIRMMKIFGYYFIPTFVRKGIRIENFAQLILLMIDLPTMQIFPILFGFFQPYIIQFGNFQNLEISLYNNKYKNPCIEKLYIIFYLLRLKNITDIWKKKCHLHF